MKYFDAEGIFIFEETEFDEHYPKAHKSKQGVESGSCKRQVSKKANIQRAKVKVHCDSQNGSHLRRED